MDLGDELLVGSDRVADRAAMATGLRKSKDRTKAWGLLAWKLMSVS